MEQSKTIRLNKVARDLNVGISTIVDFLKKKGAKIESDPNAKIPVEYYDLLIKEYSTDSAAKKESDKIIQQKNKNKKVELTVDESKEEEFEEHHEAETVLHIKDVSANNNPVEHTKKIEKTPYLKKEIPIEKKEFKIIGKIDLNNLNKTSNKNVQETEVIQEKIQTLSEEITIHTEEKTIHIEPEQKSLEEKIEKKEKSLEEIIKQPDTIHLEEIKEKIVEVVPEVIENKVIQEDSIDQKEIQKENQKIDQNEQLTKEKLKEQKEHDAYKESIEDAHEDVKNLEEKLLEIREIVANIHSKNKENMASNVPTERKESEIKVVGRIDLDALNQKTRPQKKTKKQKIQERRDKENRDRDLQRSLHGSKSSKPQGDNQNTTQKDDESNASEVYKTQITKLSGLTVVGKIELPDENKKKPVASSNEKSRIEKKKKRRKRKKDQTTTGTDEKRTEDQNKNNQNAPKKDDQRRTGTNQNQSQNQNQNQKKKKVVKKEVNEEDVQKQIKETLAKLTVGKQKSKGAKHRKVKRELLEKKMQDAEDQKQIDKQILRITEFVSVAELASLMDVPANKVIEVCMNYGLFVSINQRLDAESLSIIAEEFGYKVEFISIETQEEEIVEIDLPENLLPRPPIVTVMGHVDHGKTSLLDNIRETNVIAGEAGGITQHIGAYNVTLKSGKKITFLDTPGHEAFTAMRARGAKVTDIAIIVVAADDSVMPQTIEAINHATAAGVPIVFAINKIDKPGANPEKIKEELAKLNFLVEDWGGKYQSQEISAKQGLHIDELLEKVLLEAEILDLKANPNKGAVGTVIESSLDKGKGYISTILVESGTLIIGNIILAGSTFGKVRAMFNERGGPITKVGPSEPVMILGLNGAPQAGDNFKVYENDKDARDKALKLEQLKREQTLRARKHITLDEIGRRIAIGNFKELNIIVKGDVDGSIEAIADSLSKLSADQVQLNVIHKGVGQISEADVMLATASNAIIIGFQVRPSANARRLAEKEGIDIRLYSIIYDAINEIKDAIEGMLSPEIKEEITGSAEVKEIFKITKVGNIAGCMVKEGKIARSSRIRLIRDGIVVFTGVLGSLRRFKDEVKEVANGQDCGLNIEKFNDVKVGDIIEAFNETQVKRKL